MAERKLYCLSGLGADKKAFQYLSIENVELIHIEWIDPLPKETLQSYAERLFTQHIDETQDYLIMGLSFGGMLAQEFAKIKSPERLFLISTISSGSKLPFYLRVAGSLKVHRLLPDRLIKSTNFITRYLFGTQDEKVEIIFKQIQKDSDPKYIRWAIGAILTWRNDQPHQGVHIHGSKDRLLPLKEKAQFVVKDGGHLMLIDHADKVSSILNEQINK